MEFNNKNIIVINVPVPKEKAYKVQVRLVLYKYVRKNGERRIVPKLHRVAVFGIRIRNKLDDSQQTTGEHKIDTFTSV